MVRAIVSSLAISVFLLSLAVSCTSDNEEDTDPQPQPQPQQCDTSNVTYALTVSSILSANCYSCHSSAIATSGVVLDTHAGVKKQAESGKLVGVVSHAAGYPPMPQGGAKLADCNIAKIKKWVDEGAKDN